jgi:hypothetical protein
MVYDVNTVNDIKLTWYKVAALCLRRLVVGFPLRQPGSGDAGFVVDRTALEQVFSKYLGSPAKHSTSCSTLIIIHHHLRLVQ